MMCGLVWVPAFKLLFVCTRSYPFKKFYLYRKLDMEDENVLIFIMIDKTQLHYNSLCPPENIFSTYVPKCIIIDFFYKKKILIKIIF